MGDDALFALAERCSRLGDGNWCLGGNGEPSNDDGQDWYDDDDDPDEESVVVKLGDGGWHVCYGMSCPHVQQSSEGDRLYICKLSGRVVARQEEASHDASWTGRSCTSADPDMQSAATGGAAWRFKRSAFAASAAAYNNAHSLELADRAANAGVSRQAQPAASSSSQDDRERPAKDAKRGAPCVVDVDDDVVQSQKRNKALRRIASLQNRTVQMRLLSDASSVVTKLFSTVASSSSTSATPAASSKDRAVSGGAVTLDDPRLENYDFVLNMALKRYAARCKQQRDAPTLMGIHDVCIAANAFVKQRQKAASERDAKAATVPAERKIALNGKTVELCSTLILNLWTAMCTTPHFVEHQTGDSFRPFAAGVMYALKRGLRLPNNMVLVPAVEALANQLPTLRSSTATQAARQLQQASHRGLCAIQRGIASIDKMSVEEQQVALEHLRLVANTGARLATFVSKNVAT